MITLEYKNKIYILKQNESEIFSSTNYKRILRELNDVIYEFEHKKAKEKEL